MTQVANDLEGEEAARDLEDRHRRERLNRRRRHLRGFTEPDDQYERESDA